MDEHPLHKAVGDILEEFAKNNNLETRLDRACGGTKNVPLFSGAKANATRLCCVDAMLLKNKEITVVIEIEESNIKPTQICGKYLTTALSTEYNYKDNEHIDIKKNSVCFIQILDTSSLKPNSKKDMQFQNIKSRIKNNLCGCVKSYDLIYINLKKDHNNLKKELTAILNKSR
ncbi:hypothetical protein R83H12_02000 [Fibrobacteria bacterium R8-3-H12]